MALCFVSIGSNVAREQNISAALAALREQFGPLLVSSIYETASVGFDGAPFYNLVVGFATEQPPQQVAAVLDRIETRLGRIRRAERYGPRTIDLDLMLYGDQIISEENLRLPRAEIDQYAYVLEPLAEIAPSLTHPKTGSSYAARWQQLHDAVPGKRLRFDIGG